MSPEIQRWYFRREVELMSGLGEETAERFEAAVSRDRHDEAVELLRILIAVAFKLSRVLWPRGVRVTDLLEVDAAGEFRRSVGMEQDFPLAPARIISAIAALQMTPAELGRAVDLEQRAIHLSPQPYRIDPLITAVHEVRRLVGAATE